MTTGSYHQIKQNNINKETHHVVEFLECSLKFQIMTAGSYHQNNDFYYIILTRIRNANWSNILDEIIF